MSAVALVDVFMDTNKWMEFFPSIVSKAHTIDVLVNGMGGRSESLILMYEELHIMTPVVPIREFSFLRYCRQIKQGLWAIADVSVDLQRDAHFGGPPRGRRLPSGCLIADMANGYSKVLLVSPFGDLGRTHGDVVGMNGTGEMFSAGCKLAVVEEDKTGRRAQKICLVEGNAICSNFPLL
ncbi:hypothetical protein GUJ93_ZPchr0002g25103 [Zizania palustris]|uniref:START domain-containing protein n=1 Tax=Zizania palustris TaxID=103762 RepID=A0A8J5RZS5_ZIZPA|nr:hypothetical protein GUJ93_ZPchr0002g25103 [Zizania palustris]